MCAQTYIMTTMRFGYISLQSVVWIGALFEGKICIFFYFPPKPLHPEGTYVMLDVFLIRKPSRFKKLKKEQGRGKIELKKLPS